jgi:hypothetical protein
MGFWDIGQPKNLKVGGSKKIKGPTADSQHLLRFI